MPSDNPEYLLQELGVMTPEQIDIDAIAQYCGATVVYDTLTGCEGRIFGWHDQAYITVNRRVKRERQRFSAAHELAHWLLNRGTIAQACTEDMFRKEWVDDTVERRANRCAADLLLPNSMVSPIVRDCDVSFAMVEQLSERFKTTFTATAIRLIELAPFPAMLICSEHSRRRWFVRSPLLPAKIIESTKREQREGHSPKERDQTQGTPEQRLARRRIADVWIEGKIVRVGIRGASPSSPQRPSPSP